MKKTAGWIALGVAAVLGVGGIAVGTAVAQQASDTAGNGPQGRHGRWMERGERIREMLGLTDDQVAQARTLRQTFRDATKDLRDQVRAQVEKIPALLRSGSFAQADLLAIHDQIHELEGQIGEQRVASMYQFLELLTADQRAKIADFIEQHADHMGLGVFGEMGGRGGRGGRGGFCGHGCGDDAPDQP